MHVSVFVPPKGARYKMKATLKYLDPVILMYTSAGQTTGSQEMPRATNSAGGNDKVKELVSLVVQLTVYINIITPTHTQKAVGKI